MRKRTKQETPPKREKVECPFCGQFFFKDPNPRDNPLRRAGTQKCPYCNTVIDFDTGFAHSTRRLNGTEPRPVDVVAARLDDEALRRAAETLKTLTVGKPMMFTKKNVMYRPGDEKCPMFTEAWLYAAIGKEDARTVLSCIRRLVEHAGVKFDDDE